MLFSSAYATTAMSGYPVEKTERELRKALHEYALDRNPPKTFPITKLNKSVMYLNSANSAAVSIPTLRHPFPFTEDGEVVVVCDARTMVSLDKESYTYVVKASSSLDFDNLNLSSMLTAAWAEGHAEEMRSMSVAPAVIYARWIGSSIAGKLMLEADEQQAIEIVCALFYYNLFTEKPETDEVKLYGYFSRHMGYDPKTCERVLSRLDRPLMTVTDLCEAFRIVTESVRLDKFNAGVLYSIVGHTYFGTLGRELCAIALEYPPIWISMVYNAHVNSIYKKSSIGRMMEKGSLKEKMSKFAPALEHFLLNTQYKD